jgi:hypothetical protein
VTRQPIDLEALDTLDTELAATSRTCQDLTRFLASAAADHLDRAARLLSHAPSRDAVRLTGEKTAAVLIALSQATADAGKPPFEILGAINGLTAWSLRLADEAERKKSRLGVDQPQPRSRGPDRRSHAQR